ncbi:MAG: hypothetical protein LBM77_01625 [Spirochaetaceae bacterium]|jgi:hypothetical protein|nr:hypothetical protein [Spirochaetaceae bacterium]
MLTAEWNWDDAKRVWQKEAGENARKQARQEDARNVIDLIKSGHTTDDLLKIFSERLSSTESSQYLSAR